MHPDDPMYAYVMKHKRVETKKVISLFESHTRIVKLFGQKEWFYRKVDVMKLFTFIFVIYFSLRKILFYLFSYPTHSHSIHFYFHSWPIPIASSAEQLPG